MPKRTDISTIMIIGAGPSSSARPANSTIPALRPARRFATEGYRIVLVNSNPATIMTDPDMADRTYVEPITPEIVAKIIEKERYAVPGGFALLPTMGGQTALNCALSLEKMGVLKKFDVEMIGATRPRHRQGRRPRTVPRGDDEDRPRHAALSSDQDLSEGARRRSTTSACRRSSALPSRSAARAAASPTTRVSSSRSSSAASTPRRPMRC